MHKYHTPLRLVATVFIIGALLAGAGCSSDGGSDADPTGTMSATIGGVAFVATSFTKRDANGRSILTTSADGRRLDLTFVGISGPGPHVFFNPFLGSAPGVSGSYFANGETYNVDSGSIAISAYSNSRIAATFTATARGLLGAADLAIVGGMIDVTF